MIREHLILGISLHERPEAQVWSFVGNAPVTKEFSVEIKSKNPESFNDNIIDIMNAPAQNINALVQQVESAGFNVRSNKKGRSIAAVGVAVPGNIDTKNGIINNMARFRYAPDQDHMQHNGQVGETNIKAECDIELPLFLNNDVTCQAAAANKLNEIDDNNKYESLVYM